MYLPMIRLHDIQEVFDATAPVIPPQGGVFTPLSLSNGRIPPGYRLPKEGPSPKKRGFSFLKGFLYPVAGREGIRKGAPS
jgi:hypothetical protein